MLRRDFLKFIGVLGVTAAAPLTQAAQTEMPSEPFVSVPAPVDPVTTTVTGDQVKLCFDFEGTPVEILAAEGNFTWHEYQDTQYDFTRGVLEVPRKGDVHYDFSLDALVETISDKDFYKKVRESQYFDLTIVTAEVKYTITKGTWECLNYDAAQGAFTIQGRMSDITVTVW